MCVCVSLLSAVCAQADLQLLGQSRQTCIVSLRVTMSVARVYSRDKPEHGGSASSSQPVPVGRQGAHEEGVGTGWVSEDSSDTEEDVQDPDEATQQFLEYLLWNKERGHMTAKQIWTVAFLASKAGATGMEVLAVDPKSSGGNYQKKLDTLVGKTRGPALGMTYVVSVPAYVPSEGSRQLWDLHTMPPHEVLSTCHVGEREAMVSEFAKRGMTSSCQRPIPSNLSYGWSLLASSI